MVITVVLTSGKKVLEIEGPSSSFLLFNLICEKFNQKPNKKSQDNWTLLNGNEIIYNDIKEKNSDGNLETPKCNKINTIIEDGSIITLVISINDYIIKNDKINNLLDNILNYNNNILLYYD